MKVKSIISTKSGVSKTKGTPYTVTTVELEDGKQADTLQTVKIGDEGEAVWNDKFNKYDFKRNSYTASGATQKSYTADPAKSESIQRQSTLERAVELVVASSEGQKLKDKVEAVKATYEELYDYIFGDAKPNEKPNDSVGENHESLFDFE